ncbi:MAG: sulfatase [Candidatus Hydrogenedentes bacterium]|nr:sulfatase [Candidatus Hydrogenedentota bacterium]
MASAFRIRATGWLGIALLLLLPAGCTELPWQTRPVLSWSNLNAKTVHRDREWRGARRVAGQVVELGAIPQDAFLRIGVLDEGFEPIRVRVYAGDRRAAEFATAGVSGWVDRRLDLSRAGFAGLPCRVWIESKHPVWVGPCEVRPPASRRPNVLIVLIDTLRQDHAGCFGYARETTPHLDALARDAALIRGLTPPSSWTRPSVASLLTGTYPNTHGAQDRVDKRRADVPTLADALRAAGYESQGFVTNLHCLPTWNMGIEFDRYVNVRAEEWHVSEKDADAVALAAEALRGLAGRPWFLYVHLMSPHGPYTPPEPFASAFASAGADERQRAIDAYDAEIAYADALTGELLDTLRELGLYDNTLTLVLSDHGEEFWEHGGVDHGKTLYEEQLRVPCILKLPGGAHAGTTHDALHEMSDIAPTLLELLGLPPEPRFEGVSFATDLSAASATTDHIVFADLRLDGACMRAVKTAAVKHINDELAGRAQWFDLQADPGELAPMQAPPQGGARLLAHLARMAVHGARGLHVLVTSGPEEAGRVEIVLDHAGDSPCRVFYPEEMTRVRREAGRLIVELDMGAKDRFFPDARVWHERYQCDGARVCVDLPHGASAALRVTANDKQVPEDAVFLGASRAHAPLDGAPLPLDKIIDSPAAYDMALLPRRFAVYAWYTPAAEQLPDGQLAPELTEAMRALGYMN